MTMRHLALVAAGVFVIAASSRVEASAISPAGLARIDGRSPIEFVQEKKSEPIKEKVKRIWRNLTGYKFDVACPAFAFAMQRTTCTATGKNAAEASAKCQSQHQFCQLAPAKR
jgi:hypothetical protein